MTAHAGPSASRRAGGTEGGEHPMSAEACVREYLEAFQRGYRERNPLAVRDSFFLPATFVTPAGIRLLDSEEAFERFESQTLTTLDEQHFARTDPEMLSVREVSPVAALVDLDFVRTNTEGEQYLRGSVTYVVVYSEEQGWRILSVLARAR